MTPFLNYLKNWPRAVRQFFKTTVSLNNLKLCPICGCESSFTNLSEKLTPKQRTSFQFSKIINKLSAMTDNKNKFSKLIEKLNNKRRTSKNIERHGLFELVEKLTMQTLHHRK